MLEVALLGIGGGMPMPERYLSALLMNYRGRKILVDCGEGTQVSMRLLGWGFKTIDLICITHVHGDHIVGLPGLLSTIGNSGRTEPLTIVGPEGITEVINGLRVIAPFLPYEINIIENPLTALNIGILDAGMTIDAAPIEIEIGTLQLEHSAPCLGYSFYVKRRPKFDVDKAIANNVPKNLWNKLQKSGAIEYEGKIFTPDLVLGEERTGIKISLTTDTRPIAGISDFIKGSRLFVCEGTYGAEDDLEKAIKNKHMLFREAAELARDGKVDELLLTHFSPVMQEPQQFIDNAKAVFANTSIGQERLIRTLNFE